MNENTRPDNLIMKNAQILRGGYRNFSGKGSQKNPEGKRTFCIILDEETAASLIEEGWNVKYTKPKSDEYEPVPFLKVNVNYAYKPPVINMYTSESMHRTRISEKTVGDLDWAEIKYVDVNIKPSSKKYDHPDGTPATYSAYLQSMNVIIEEDPIRDMYQNDDEFDEE